MKTSICIFFALVAALWGWLGYTCHCEFEFDPNNSSGLIVSTLGVIVTALVGWQAFNAIENTKTLNKFEDLERLFQLYVGMETSVDERIREILSNTRHSSTEQ